MYIFPAHIRNPMHLFVALYPRRAAHTQPLHLGYSAVTQTHRNETKNNAEHVHIRKSSNSGTTANKFVSPENHHRYSSTNTFLEA